MDRKDFIQKVAKACKNNQLSLFVGAGMSKGAGLPSWKELCRPMAEELGIDLDGTKYSLYDITQFYANSEQPSELHRMIQNAINQIGKESKALDELTKVQCTSIWTTNFDTILEDAYRKNGTAVKTYFSQSDLKTVDFEKGITLFKMNGDIHNLSEAIITKDDLECYNQKHELFLTFFKRQLVVNSFLFLGYSFSDSLVLPCISELNQIFGGQQMPHYTIMLKSDNSDDRNFVRDLEERYKIRVLLIDSYEELKDVLGEINYYTNQHNVFISGAAWNRGNAELKEIDEFCSMLANKLYKKSYKIINGYGFKVGYYIAAAATKIMMEQNINSFSDYLAMYPFDEHLPEEEKAAHREYIISKANTAIFLYGSDKTDSGMVKEFEIARKDPRKIIIPAGSTGGAARYIWNEVKMDIIHYPYLEKVIDELGSETNPERLTDLILDIINKNVKFM